VPVLIADQFLFEAPAEPFVPAEPDRTALINGLLVIMRSSTFTRTDASVVTFNIVEWQDANGTDVTLAGSLPKETLFKIGKTARLASATEWTQLASSFRDNFSVGIGPSTTVLNQPSYLPLEQAVIDGGDTWNLSLSLDEHAMLVDREAPDGSGRSGRVPFTVDALQPVHVFNTIPSTAVAVVVSYGTASSARFTVAGREPVTSPLVLVRASVLGPAVVAATFAYSDPQPVFVELLDANGAVVPLGE
jgi:hypothetical protein